MIWFACVLDKKQEYFEANAKFLSACKSIADIKHRYGRCTALEVSQISEQIEENNYALYETEAEINYYKF